MADAIYKSRTNYFRVKDRNAFREELKNYGITAGDWDTYSDIVLDDSSTNKPEGAIALFCDGFWPQFDEDSVAERLGAGETEDVPQEFEAIEDLIAKHLVDTDVAVIIGVGSEKFRYVDGYAVAINAKGDKRSIRLDDIYDLAQEIATADTPVTQALY